MSISAYEIAAPSWADCNHKISQGVCRVSGSSLERNAMVGTKTSGRRENKNPMPLNPASCAQKLKSPGQIMRKSAPGSWKHILNSGGWESTSSQAEIPHERLVQEVTPLSWNTGQEPACNFWLRGYWKAGTSLTPSSRTGTQAASCDHVLPQSLPGTLSWAGHCSWANTPFPNQQSSAEDPNGSQQFPVLAGWADVEPELSQTKDVVVLT